MKERPSSSDKPVAPPSGSSDRRPPSHFAPPISAAGLFVVAQVAALAASAGGWRFSHGWPVTPGTNAVAVVAVAQVIAATLLAPSLLRTSSSALAVGGMSCSFLLAAAAIEPAPAPIVPPTVAWMLLWLSGLAIGMAGPARRWLTPMLLLWLGADVVLAYAGPDAPLAWRPLASVALGPSTVSHFAPHLPLLATTTAATTTAAVIAAPRRRNARQHSPH